MTFTVRYPLLGMPAPNVLATSSDPFLVPIYSGAAGQTLLYQTDMSSVAGLTMTDLWNAHNSAPCIAPSDASFSAPENLMTVVAGGGPTGNAILRISYSGVAQEGNALRTWGIPTSLASVARFAKVTARMHMSSALSDSMGVKFFQFWHTTGNDRIQWHFTFQGPCVSGANLTYWQIEDNSLTSTCQSAQPLGPFFVDMADNAWHEFSFAYLPCTSTGVGGYAMAWYGSQLMTACHVAKLNVTPTNGLKVWCVQDNLDKLAVNEGLSDRNAFGGVQTTDTPAWTYDLAAYETWTGSAR